MYAISLILRNVNADIRLLMSSSSVRREALTVNHSMIGTGPCVVMSQPVSGARASDTRYRIDPIRASCDSR